MKDKTFYPVLKKWGGSIAVIIPNSIVEELSLLEDDYVKMILHKLEEEKTQSYRCRRCEYRFDSDDEIPECPACGETNLETFKR